MASSPPSSYSSPLPNPKKRPSLGQHSSTSASASKRPKLHPLRQTSFPASEAQLLQPTLSATARSETGSLANSAFSTTSSAKGDKTKRGRGRPKKDNPNARTSLTGDPLRTAEGASATSASQPNGRHGRTARSAISGRSGANADEDDDDDEGDEDIALSLTQADAAGLAHERRLEAENENRLQLIFDPEQQRRFEQYKRQRLQPSTLRKIVNQVVSQSVTQNPLTAINIYAKYYVGEIVERAREVQLEWARAHEKDEEVKRMEAIADGKPVPKREPNQHQGGMLPDHLREAVRRYKGDGEGGGVGFEGNSFSMMGLVGSGAYRVGQGNGARRLFR